MPAMRHAGLFLLILGLTACQQDMDHEAAMEDATDTSDTASAVRQSYPNLPTDVVFENDRVIAQKVTAEPGTWSGEHSHTGGQLLIVLEDGTVTFREGGEETSRDFKAGDVELIDAVESHDHTNAGDAPMSFVLVSIAPGEGGAAEAQVYPNRPAEVVFEDDRVIAQRLMADPGSWAGEHGHAGNQLAVVIKGGEMTYREGGEETERTFAAGDVFEVEAVESHDHTVTSNSGVESIVLTIK